MSSLAIAFCVFCLFFELFFPKIPAKFNIKFSDIIVPSFHSLGRLNKNNTKTNGFTPGTSPATIRRIKFGEMANKANKVYFCITLQPCLVRSKP